MLVNIRELTPGSEILADICIVGSGPAGIALAREYDGSPLKVIILEAGNQEPESPRSSRQRLASSSSLGDFYFDLPGRQVGGNSNRWGINAPGTKHGIRLLPLRPVDFERREWMPGSGWPVPASYFDGYYGRALGFFGLPDRGFEGQDWADADAPALALDRNRVQTGVFQFADGEGVSIRHRDALIASKNVTLYTNAAATEVRLDHTGKNVEAITVAAGPKARYTVLARQFVLAAGALWTTQLLLASGKLGNSGGHLGRNLSVHPLLLGGRFYPSSPELYERMKLYDLRSVGGAGVMGHLQLADDVVRKEKLLGSSFLMFAIERGAKPKLSPRQKSGFDAFSRLRDAAKAGLAPAASDVLRTIVGFDGLVRRLVASRSHQTWHFDVGGWSTLPDQRTHFEGFEVFQITEQALSPDNYLYLSDERDDLGMPKLGIQWSYSEDNCAAIRRTQHVFKEELAKAGLGTFEIASEPDGKPTMLNAHANHYFGVTRMSRDPQDGVVDTDCRVHGVSNLYVASSSVFPTGGFANPTLTIIALALRVADHLKRAMLADERTVPSAEIAGQA